jgi:hypothetical protein
VPQAEVALALLEEAAQAQDREVLGAQAHPLQSQEPQLLEPVAAVAGVTLICQIKAGAWEEPGAEEQAATCIQTYLEGKAHLTLAAAVAAVGRTT